MFPGYVNPDELLIDTGVLYGQLDGYGDALLGVGATIGGLKFNPTRSLRNVPFDGKQADIEGNDRFVQNGSPTIAGNMLDMSRKTLGILEPGSTSADSGSMARIQPAGNSVFLEQGAYVRNLLWVRRMKGASLIDVVGFPVSIVEQYEEIGEEKNEIKVATTFSARLPKTATNIEDVPYRRFRVPSIAALVALFPDFWNIAGYDG
ncbi:MAG: hypothetical protein V4617_15120 [Gemmatimonadota bacterium]